MTDPAKTLPLELRLSEKWPFRLHIVDAAENYIVSVDRCAHSSQDRTPADVMECRDFPAGEQRDAAKAANALQLAWLTRIVRSVNEHPVLSRQAAADGATIESLTAILRAICFQAAQGPVLQRDACISEARRVITADRFTIEPQYEPDGEGCGWRPCSWKDATIFVVCCNPTPDDQCAIASFGSLSEARAAYPTAILTGPKGPSGPKIDALLTAGFTVGRRDPRLNQDFPGAYMVVAPYTEADLPTKDARNGPWCIVGDDLTALVDEAFDFLSGGA